MERTNIPFDGCQLNALRLFDEWLLLAAGDFAAKALDEIARKVL